MEENKKDQKGPYEFNFNHISFEDLKDQKISSPRSGNYLLLKLNGDEGFDPEVSGPRGTHTVLWAGLYDNGLSFRMEAKKWGHFHDPKRRLVDEQNRRVYPTDVLYTSDPNNFRRISDLGEFTTRDNVGLEDLLHYLLVPYFGQSNNKSRNNGGAIFKTSNQVTVKRDANSIKIYRPWQE